MARWQSLQIDSLLLDWEFQEKLNNVQQCMIFVTAQVCQGFSPLLVWMKGKCMCESNTTICMAAPTMLFFTYQFKEEWKAISSWEQHRSHYILWEPFIQGVGFLDCSQLLKIKLNGNLPINDTTKAHGIYECYHIVDSCIADKPSWSSWPLVLWVPFTLQIGLVCDTNLFPSVLVWIAHSITFINQLVACPLSKFQMLTGAVVWTLVIVLCFECGILVAEWLPNASAMGLLKASKGLNWMWCCSMGSN
jgi:hypothetical protein